MYDPKGWTEGLVNGPLPNLRTPLWREFLNKCSHVNSILAHFEALELNSLLILRFWSFKFLEICDLEWKLDLENRKNAEMVVLGTARRVWKGVSRATHTSIIIFLWVSCPSLIPSRTVKGEHHLPVTPFCHHAWTSYCIPRLFCLFFWRQTIFDGNDTCLSCELILWAFT